MPPSPETLDVSGRDHDPAGPGEAANPLGLSQAMILRNASAEIMRRGEEYVRRGAVGALVLRGNVLTAEVEGSEDEPYRVSVTLNGPSGPAVDVAEASCDCPYDWGGWCKHIVAVVLAAVRAAPGEVERAPAVEELLASLDAAGLRALIAGLVKNDPRRADEVAALVERQQQRPAAKGQAATVPAAPDTARLRRQVRAALRSLGRMDDSQAYWQVGRVVGEVRALAESEASERLQAGDGRGALVVLEAVTDAYAKDWTDLDDSDGDASNFFFDIAPLWTEAVLTAVDDLSQAERTAWARKLDGWQRALEDYGVDDVFHAPIEAARRGWGRARPFGRAGRRKRGAGAKRGPHPHDRPAERFGAAGAARGISAARLSRRTARARRPAARRAEPARRSRRLRARAPIPSRRRPPTRRTPSAGQRK
jgi:uncharacterized Zn finger protein